MLTFTSNTGLSWKLNLRAAQLVANDAGDTGLPPPIGDIRFSPITNPARFGIGEHPQKKRFPGLQVQHHLMIIEEQFKVERNGVRGVALYADFNGSDLCTSIIGANGRNIIAPWNWEGEANSPTDPAATPDMEWRQVLEGDQTFTWQNSLIHGWAGWDGKDKRLDWLDGTPENLATMYERGKGRVGQSIMVPHEIPGVGVAEQTMEAADVTQTFSILLRFPVPEAAKQAEKLARIWQEPSPYRPQMRDGGGGLYLSTKSANHEIFGARSGKATLGYDSGNLDADYKMATGGWIRQHVITNPFSHGFWNPNPEVLIVCWPISKRRAREIGSSDLDGRRMIF